jgi:DNA-binding NarL/FixJ family response regulator
MLESSDPSTNHQAQFTSTEILQTPKNRVLIVEDHPLVRERLAQLINHELDMVTCGEAENAEQALQIARDTSPNLAIVDISLRNSNGLDVIKAIRAQNGNVPVLVLSMHEETLYAERAMRAGANGYVTKHQPVEQILLAIRRVMAGQIYLSENLTNAYLKSIGTGSKMLPRRVSALTDRELEVFSMIGRGMAKRDIADTLQLGVATVNTHCARIKEKLNLRSGSELQHLAFRWVREQER